MDHSVWWLWWFTYEEWWLSVSMLVYLRIVTNCLYKLPWRPKKNSFLGMAGKHHANEYAMHILMKKHIWESLSTIGEKCINKLRDRKELFRISQKSTLNHPDLDIKFILCIVVGYAPWSCACVDCFSARSRSSYRFCHCNHPMWYLVGLQNPRKSSGIQCASPIVFFWVNTCKLVWT